MKAASETDKQKILDGIRRTAAENGGVPLGVDRFYQETGIKDWDWRGKIWVRWGDALREAGFEPNQLNPAYPEEFLLAKFTQLIRDIGHFPVSAEIRMAARGDSDFPSHNVFARFGSKRQLAARVREHCMEYMGYEAVATIMLQQT